MFVASQISISRRRRTCRQSDFDLVARLRFLFVRPCAARSSAQVTWTRGRGHPTVPGARWRSPLALTSDHPPPIHPFVFEAVAPRKLVSQLREITFSGPLASFVGKNFDTRQDACWGQLRDEAVCSPLVNGRRLRHQRISVLPHDVDRVGGWSWKVF